MAVHSSLDGIECATGQRGFKMDDYAQLHPGAFAARTPDRPAIIMANGGRVIAKDAGWQLIDYVSNANPISALLQLHKALGQEGRRR